MALVPHPNRGRGRPFLKGISGNPQGRPRGARNKATLRMEALFDEAGEALAEKLIDRSLKGDMAAMRLCLKVMFPAGRKRGVAIALPLLETIGDCMKARAMVVDAATQGELTLDEAKAFSDLIDGQYRALVKAEEGARAVVIQSSQA